MSADHQATGRGVTAAIIDSGFYPHPDFASRVLLHVDATDDHISDQTRYGMPCAYCWHGTMTAAIAAGNGGSSNGLYPSLAPDLQLVLIKVLNSEGRLREADIARGLRWVLAHHRQYNIRIVNLSVGGDHPSRSTRHPLHLAVRALASEGIIVVAAAGNRPDAPLLPPASAPEALTVSGYDDRNSTDRALWRPRGHQAARTARRTQADVLAPAAWIASPMLPGTASARQARWLWRLIQSAADGETLRACLDDAGPELGLPPGASRSGGPIVMKQLVALMAERKVVTEHTQHVDGTSVAAAIVSSVAAQVLEIAPHLSPKQVKQAIVQTAWAAPHEHFAPDSPGLLNPAGAVAAVREISR